MSCDKELGALFREQGWSHRGQCTDLPHEGKPSVTEVTDRGGGRHPGEVEGAWDSGANQRAQQPSRLPLLGGEMRGVAPGPASPLRLSLPGEQRGAALVALLQPLCQLHHREHHQSPEPQSHGHRGHVRCGGLLEAEGWGGARDTGVLPNVDSWVHTVSLSPNPQAPPPVPTPLPQSLWWPPLEQPLGQHHLRLCPSQNQEEGDTVGGRPGLQP